MLAKLLKTKIASGLFFAILVVVIGLVLSRTLFSTNLPVTHDLELHAARAANYYLALRQGQLPPRWAPNLNFGFGYPTFIFSYQYPYWLTTGFFIITDSIELSVNLFVILSLILGGLGIFCFAWLRLGEKYSGRGWQAFIMAVAYMTAPYILLNIFVRGAIGEVGFWSLLPWVLFLLLQCRSGFKTWLVLVLPLVLVVWLLSHQVLALLSLPILGLWLSVENGGWEKLFHSQGKMLLWLVAISLLMVMYSWLPMLTEKRLVGIGYEGYQPHSYAEQFPPTSWLLYSPWEYSGLVDRSEDGRFTRMIGWEYWLVALVGGWLVWREKKKHLSLKFWLGMFWGSVVLMLPITLFIWKLLPPLQYVQHPWRLIGFSVVAGTLVWLEWLRVKKQKSALIKSLNFLVILSAIWAIINWAKPVSTFHKPTEQWLEYHLTGDSYSELNPITFDRGENIAFPEKLYFQNSHQDLSKLEPINLVWTGSNVSYDFVANEAGRVIQKTAYFPGWQLLINGQAQSIDASEASWSGRVTYQVASGPNHVEVIFSDQGTKRQLANSLSLLGVGLWLSTLGFVLFGELRHHFQNR